MTLEYRKGDLFSVTEGIIAHGCNAQGVMGSGVARIVRERYPTVYERYISYHNKYKLELGEVQVVQVYDYPNLFIANMITQEFYGRTKREVSYDAIDECFDNLMARNFKEYTINTPKIGAGLGGGDWSIIEAIIKSNLAKYKGQKVVVWEI